MRPSPSPPPVHDFSPSPSSACSCADSRSPCSATQYLLSPSTPESCFSTAPAIVTPDEFALQIDVQIDKVVQGSPHKSSSTLFPLPSVPSARTNACLPSEDDISKGQVTLRNRGRWYDPLESSPPLCLHDASRDSTSDAYSCEPAHSPFVGTDSSRYSLLIHEVSLLVGLAPGDDRLLPGDSYPHIPDEAREVPDVLPLSLTPIKSLSSRKHGDAILACPTDVNVSVHQSSIHIPSSTSLHVNNSILHNERPLPARPREPVTPIPRHKSAEPVRPSLSPRRRQGQVFHVESPSSIAYRRNAVDLDETFSHPREPPPMPTLSPPANRCSSLDRLECSLRKLEAYAPRNHCKSQSEGQSPDHVRPWKDKRPSLPPSRCLKSKQSSHEITCRNPSRPVTDVHSSSPPPAQRPTPLHQYVARHPPLLLDNGYRGGDRTPGSFMDMDVAPTEEASPTRQASLRQATSKERRKSLVSVARRMSRGIVAWGKNLTGSKSLATTAVKSANV